MMFWLWLWGCGAPDGATEIGNPEMSVAARLAPSSPDWIGVEGLLEVQQAQLRVAGATITTCDGETTEAPGATWNLLDALPQTWAVPGDWCSIALQLAPNTEAQPAQPTVRMEVLDGFGRTLQLIDTRPQEVVLSAPAPQAVEAELTWVFDPVVWLDGLEVVPLSNATSVEVQVDVAPVAPLEDAVSAEIDAGGGAEVLLAAVVFEDQDGDGLSDAREATLLTSPTEADSDGDGLSDAEETVLAGTSPIVADSDGDGLSDGEELGGNSALLDADNDGYNAAIDCDDNNAAVNPGAAEVPDDGIDNDCDGLL